jgi:hypothetical protein
MKILNAVVGIWTLIAKYPAAAAAIGNIVVVLGASFGLHFSVDQLAATAAIVAGVFGILVHAGVIPVTKVDNVKAGISPTIKGKASVLSTPMSGDDSKVPDAMPRLHTMPESTRNPFGSPK